MDDSRRRFSKLVMLMSGLPFAFGLSNEQPESITGKLLNYNSQLRELGKCYFESGHAPNGLIEHFYLNLEKLEKSFEFDPYSSRAFCELVDREFDKGEVINVEGWILSKAEVAIGLVAYMSEDTGIPRK